MNRSIVQIDFLQNRWNYDLATQNYELLNQNNDLASRNNEMKSQNYHLPSQNDNRSLLDLTLSLKLLLAKLWLTAK